MPSTKKDPTQTDLVDMFLKTDNWVICYRCGYNGPTMQHDEFHRLIRLRGTLK